MRAILCSSFGAAEVMRWEETPMPTPVAGQILIKVAAAGVNRADILQRQGKYPPPPGASPILGLEVSGQVAALGEGATRWKVGEKVCALSAGGGYAEYVAVDERHVLPTPDNLTCLEAATLPEAVITVWANLFEAGALRPGQTALVHGGSGGVGTMAIQMAKNLGAKIFVTAGSESKADACRGLGADLAINYKTEDFVFAVLRATDQRGVDVVVDMVGGDYINRNLAVLAEHGRHISIATQQGRMASVDFRLVMQKQLILTGSTLRGRSADEKARLVAEVAEKVWPWVKKGLVKPLIHHVCPIKNAVEAHKMMESGAQIGKIALEVAS